MGTADTTHCTLASHVVVPSIIIPCEKKFIQCLFQWGLMSSKGYFRKEVELDRKAEFSINHSFNLRHNHKQRKTVINL